MSRRDPMARFYTWPLIVERKTGTDQRGNAVLAPPVTIKAKIRMVSEVVTTTDGKEVTTVATASMSADTPVIPTGSRVTLPEELSSARKGHVAAEGLHDLRIPRTPRFYQIQIA
ncbi:hypothetical protein [Gordonia sp. OPL2]|uniref:hypothetical protein n=1 Tax=Gordonia sp. OPL2 TaxID=2486274 RepID=UPI0016561614|nr:hypothetical protein [Gordonia sp. OPL2]ROZ89009.1 hypothetical protein EEB19_20080 [Gordonia sp. OPL2]